MPQYQVPQFIDVEDKIFGPLTAKQFFYLIGGAVLIFILYVVFQLWVVIILGAPLAAFSLALAFLKVNGVPFIKIAGNALNYMTSKRLYLWHPMKSKTLETSGIPIQREQTSNGAGQISPNLLRNRLQDLAWSLDIQKITKR